MGEGEADDEMWGGGVQEDDCIAGTACLACDESRVVLREILRLECQVMGKEV
ncbi:conserved hypothetical protein [Ricinus communis]|uniref:Uncharacterized protein n=1 Tax=Ricinus communis TaxID=3988 RepID=B9RLU6_RICCO|nr:conserved hypothetical protein [Ricinus communis]